MVRTISTLLIIDEVKKSSGSALVFVGFLLSWSEYIFREKNTVLHIVFVCIKMEKANSGSKEEK